MPLICDPKFIEEDEDTDLLIVRRNGKEFVEIWDSGGDEMICLLPAAHATRDVVMAVFIALQLGIVNGEAMGKRQTQKEIKKALGL